jgi:4-hydroxythreonine-4-phosphate dehydrogenase
MGEPAGVGGELTVAAWLRRETDNVAPFIALDDPERLRSIGIRQGVELPIETTSSPAEAASLFHRALPVLPLELNHTPIPGAPNPANGSVVIQSIQTAVDLALDHQVSGIVTNPIHKASLIATGFAYPGHTEFLAALAGGSPVMMLASPLLRVVPVTSHVALRDVPDLLSTESIVACGRTVARALISDFGIPQPRLAVAALNPHAGEGGNFGQDEAVTIEPAIQALKADGIRATGPFPADSLFRDDARAGYDAVLCMYHDQALIPLKALDFERGVNVTLGLQFVRTSPDHGTALDLAGTGRANAQGLISALSMAAMVAGNRAALP